MADASKKWWQSKLIWSGIVATLIAAYNTAAGTFALPPIPDFVFGLLGIFGVYNRVASDGFKTPIK